MPERTGPASAGAAGRAGIGSAGRHSDTTLRTAAIDLSEIRFARAVARLHRLGPRAVHELLAELGTARMIRTEIEAIVARYLARLDPDTLHAVGGDRFPAPPLHRIGVDG
jgi:hypothetical protein